MEVDQDVEDWDDYLKATMILCRCPCCVDSPNNCKLYIDGNRVGHCQAGGPYLGWLDMTKEIG